MTDGVGRAVELAKAAAGAKQVQVVGGPGLVRELLAAGAVDELRVDIMPVVLGDGLRLLEELDPEQVQLEKLDVREVGARTSLRFRVSSSAEKRFADRG